MSTPEVATQEVPLVIRVRIFVMRFVVAILKVLHLREPILRGRVLLARRGRANIDRDHKRARPALFELDRQMDALINKDGGFFIEAGANDGYTQSNTYWLERFRGWSGLLVEPMQENYELCKEERPGSTVVQAALVSPEYEGDTVPMRFAGLMSTMVGDHERDFYVNLGQAVNWRDPYEADVPARTLSSLLDEMDAPEVDLLSLDVEGLEPQVLAGLDLDRHAPRWILIEIVDEEKDCPPVEAVLGDRYVRHGRVSPLDLVYRRADVSA